MKVGLIGYGSRLQGMVRHLLKDNPDCEIAALVDPRASEKLERPELANAKMFATPEEMLSEVQLDGVMIGTRCSLHTDLACRVLPSGLPLFLEKPVSTTMEDLHRLRAAHAASSSPVVVSFPLRVTTIVQLAKEIIDSGLVGTIEHAQAVNNVPYGNVYYQNWYRDEAETGGLFLQKATHDFDYINYVLGLKPTEVCAMTSKQIFKGDKPAGLTCVECSENRTCPESTAFNPELKEAWPYCCFAEDTGNEDSGSALVRYASGMHLSYSQNFFARRKAAARGARFLGYKGTVDFDFYTGKIQVAMHHSGRVDTHEFGNGEGHFGGDTALLNNFAAIVRGETKDSVSPLEAGLDSALLCIQAKQSAETGTFRSLDWIKA